MRRPRKAIVLCAGLGVRMQPLSLETPKPLMPLWGRPMLDRLLDMLESWGVQDVLINVHHAADRLFSHVKARESGKLRINMSFEPEITGTGGVLCRADWFIDDQPFWMVNSDIAAELSPTSLIQTYGARPRTAAALWMHDRLGPRTVAMKDGLVTDFACPEPGTAGTVTFCGLQLVSPEVRRFCPPETCFSIVDVYRRCMASGMHVAGVCVKGAFWQDAGSPVRYLEVHRRAWARRQDGGKRAPGPDPDQSRKRRALRAAGVRVEGAVSIGQHVEVKPGARLRNCVIWDGAYVGARASISDAIVADGVRVNRRLHGGVALRAAAADDGRIGPALGRLGWPIERTVVEPLAARGSARDFLRIRWGTRHAVMVRYSLERAENGFYAGHARFLKRLGIRVPEVILDMPECRVIVMEDAGDRSLKDHVAGKSRPRVIECYKHVLGEIVRWHREGAERVRRRPMTLCEPFSEQVYRYERDLFEKYVLPRYSVRPHRAATILAELGAVADRLRAEPHVLIHRDLQSSNILIHRGEPVFIDFQGMRLGPASYDLASLLCDPYMSLDRAVREELRVAYVNMAGGDPAAWRQRFGWGAVERLVQALGAYGRLGSHRETRAFLRFIPPAWAMMQDVLTGLEGLPSLTQMVYDALQIEGEWICDG